MAGVSSSHNREIIETLGPVFSNAGLKNWDLCLAKDIVIAFPRSFWLTITTGIFAGLGIPILSQFAMRNIWAKSPETEGKRILLDTGDRNWRRYPISELQNIICVRALGANEIQFHRPNAPPDIYGLGVRRQTDTCREVLQRVYGPLYREKGFA